MVNECYYCGKSNKKDVSLFNFPLKEPDRVRKWIENMGLTGREIPSTAKICSDHFEPKFLRKTDSKVNLSENSEPTIFQHFKFSCLICKKKKAAYTIIQFHRFPLSNPKLMERWRANLPNQDLKIARNSLICSEHFKNNCYYPGGRLKPFAVPSIFSTETHAELDNSTASTDFEPFEYLEVDISEVNSDEENNDVDTKKLYNQENVEASDASTAIADHNYEMSPGGWKRKCLLLQKNLAGIRLERKLERRKLARREREIVNLKKVIGQMKKKKYISSAFMDLLSSIADDGMEKLMEPKNKQRINGLLQRLRNQSANESTNDC